MSSTADEVTEKVVNWAQSTPALRQCLRGIAIDALPGVPTGQELMCTVVDLLDPDRSDLWRDVLRATGVSPADADSMWVDLGGGGSSFINRVRWWQVERALLR